MASFTRLAGRAVTGAGVLVLSPVLGLAGLAGMAMVGAGPETFTVTGLAVFAAMFFLGLLLCVPRPGAVWGRWLRAVLILGVEAAVVWQVAGATLHPAPGLAAPSRTPQVPGQREWRLPTGSRLAYVRIAPKRVTRQDPVVFLHGGPGVADLAGDSAFFGKLAADGHQVYVYDQLGAGRSERLADPREYGLTRDVADLEAIRQIVGARRLNLVARDYGAQLAAAYLAQHPDRVAGAVLDSPAGLDRPSAAAAALPGTGGQLEPRALAVYTLLRVEPRAAHAFAGDRELEAYLGLARHREHRPCATARPGDATGSSGYAGLAERSLPGSLREGLAGSSAPVLIVKGACDEQSWSSAAAYRRALPAARFAYAGDGAAYLGMLRAFLAGRPVDTYDGDGPPPGYRGPL
ncbi:alpha/beta fold hydrolase [Nonomuraea zeae]|uniref:prolyl aminopeptidase n=1 Tax=Nonomuraea zeae TaxID=1642303 RepID=A0A5S4GWE2_9ACTN|nr:alpha/beta hydrolase [Nonomuraea zeae]TMR30790.1 alpha/beta fold hydrolase [Nonomuraea zeae]